MTARAKAMRAEGVDVLSLSAGEPDFDTPEHIKTAAQQAMALGETKYAPVPGTPALRQAVAQHAAEFYGHPVEPAQVIVSTGGKQVLYNAMQCLLDPGDEAVLASPYWVSYPDMIRLAGGSPVLAPTRADTGFLLDAAGLEATLTDNTRVVVLNSPNNPTGATYSREQLASIAEVLRRHPGVVIITDDIYAQLVYDGDFVGIAQIAPDLADRTLIVNGVSKAYAMTGWRIGFGIGPETLISAMSRVQGASTSGACTISQAAATAALTGDQSCVSEMVNVFRQRRDRMLAGLRSIPGISVGTPGGAFYAFPQVDHYFGGDINSSTALCEYLLETAHLATVPGSAFNVDTHIRLSFACSEADIDEGIRRLRTALERLHS